MIKKPLSALVTVMFVTLIVSCVTPPSISNGTEISTIRTKPDGSIEHWYTALALTIEQEYTGGSARYSQTKYPTTLRAVGRSLLTSADGEIAEFIYFLELNVTNDEIWFAMSNVQQVYGGYSKSSDLGIDLSSQDGLTLLSEFHERNADHLLSQAVEFSELITPVDIFINRKENATLDAFTSSSSDPETPVDKRIDYRDIKYRRTR
jgi:hypothetical protein